MRCLAVARWLSFLVAQHSRTLAEGYAVGFIAAAQCSAQAASFDAT